MNDGILLMHFPNGKLVVSSDGEPTITGECNPADCTHPNFGEQYHQVRTILRMAQRIVNVDA